MAHTDYSFDNVGRVTGIDHLNGSTHYGTYTLDYDNHGRIHSIVDDFPGTGSDDTRVFTYDAKDQLTVADHSGAQSDEAYAYAKNGTRSGSQTQLGGTTTYTPGQNNRITSDGTYNYTYNAEGNLSRKTRIASPYDYEEYTYDHRNRLSKIFFKDGSGVIQRTIAYRYDHANQLLRRIDVPYSGGAPGTGTTDSFVWSGGQIVMAFRKVGSGTASLTNRYLWAERVDHLLSDEKVTSLTSAGTTYWSLEDQIGTVRDLATYSSGTTTIAKHRDYDSFGNLRNDSASGVDEYFGYSGRLTESATGDTYNTFRWYKPRIGQFLQEDPIQSASGQDNWRAYVGNHPTYATDPSGLEDLGLVHAAPPINAAGIVERGLQPGSDGLRWLSTKGCPTSGASHSATVQLEYKLSVEAAREIPAEVIKEAEKAANKAVSGKGLTGGDRAAAWARAKWDQVAKWMQKQPESVFKTPAPGTAKGWHYAFKPKGWAASSPQLLAVSGKGSEQAVGALAKGATASEGMALSAATKWGNRVRLAGKVGGRALIVVGVANSVYEIYSAEDKCREAVGQASGWAGAAAGGWAGGEVGAAVGAGIGVWFGGVGAVPGAAIGGVVGGIGGAVGGFFAGEAIGEAVYDWVFTPGIADNSEE